MSLVRNSVNGTFEAIPTTGGGFKLGCKNVYIGLITSHNKLSPNPSISTLFFTPPQILELFHFVQELTGNKEHICQYCYRMVPLKTEQDKSPF